MVLARSRWARPLVVVVCQYGGQSLLEFFAAPGLNIGVGVYRGYFRFRLGYLYHTTPQPNESEINCVSESCRAVKIFEYYLQVLRG